MQLSFTKVSTRYLTLKVGRRAHLGVHKQHDNQKAIDGIFHVSKTYMKAIVQKKRFSKHTSKWITIHSMKACQTIIVWEHHNET